MPALPAPMPGARPPMTEPFEPAAPSRRRQPTQPAPSRHPSRAATVRPGPPRRATQPVSYSPAAERRPAWTDVAAGATRRTSPRRRPGPGTSRSPPRAPARPAAGTPARPAAAAPPRRHGASSRPPSRAAVVGSLGTYGILSATGALDREVATVAPVGQAQQATQPVPVSIDESSAITRAAEKVSPGHRDDRRERRRRRPQRPVLQHAPVGRRIRRHLRLRTAGSSPTSTSPRAPRSSR